jgi:hypothetical protein
MNHILVDWDNTIFCYSMLMASIGAALGKRFGFDQQIFHGETRDQAIHNDPYGYSPERHLYFVALRTLELDEDTLTQQQTDMLKDRIHDMKEVFDHVTTSESKHCLYQDVDYFLSKASRLAQVRILSYGLTSWQQQKIDASEIRKHYDLSIIITEDKQGKLPYINNLLSDQTSKVVYINDNSIENEMLYQAIKHDNFLLLEIRRRGAERSEPMFNHDIEVIEELNQPTIDRIQQFFKG